MARIAGVNIPTNKRVLIALQYIHGIGQKNAAEIIEKVKIPEDRRVSQLSSLLRTTSGMAFVPSMRHCLPESSTRSARNKRRLFTFLALPSAAARQRRSSIWLSPPHIGPTRRLLLSKATRGARRLLNGSDWKSSKP